MLNLSVNAEKELAKLAERAGKENRVLRISVILACCDEKVLFETSSKQKKDRIVYNRGFNIYANPYAYNYTAGAQVDFESGGYLIKIPAD